MIDTDKIGKFISKLRKEANLTQDEFADKLNLSTNAISKWERGINLPDADNMEAICNLFNITYTELLEGEKMDQDSIIKASDKNSRILLLTKKELIIAKVLAQTLMGIGVGLTFTFTFIISKTLEYQIVSLIFGICVWMIGFILMKKLNSLIEK